MSIKANNYFGGPGPNIVIKNLTGAVSGMNIALNAGLFRGWQWH